VKPRTRSTAIAAAALSFFLTHASPTWVHADETASERIQNTTEGAKKDTRKNARKAKKHKNKKHKD
jgi:hypothetical protein